jgi:formate-dependent nitrite reductase membrane component NrfD
MNRIGSNNIFMKGEKIMNENTVVEVVKAGKKGIGKKWFVIGGAILGLVAATIIGAKMKGNSTSTETTQQETEETEVENEVSSEE